MYKLFHRKILQKEKFCNVHVKILLKYHIFSTRKYILLYHRTDSTMVDSYTLGLIGLKIEQVWFTK